MPSRSVVVTYTFHPPTSSTLTSAIRGIKEQLPLRNLHWKPSTRTALRTIQELDVKLVELGDAGTLGREPNGSVLESPLVHLCLVTCENEDVYKSQTRSFVRDWLSIVAAKRSTYVPLIVLVNPSTSPASTGRNVFGRDRGVFGKLKTDFNTKQKERCVQLNLPAEGTTDPAAWPEVMNKLKESIVSAFDGAIVEREEEVKRGEAQRLTVGWNFCTWFLLKESLAHSFEGVNLHEDALIVYEELEASFIQILKEQNLSWFGKLGAVEPDDDSLPILNTTAKQYRQLLQTSSISIFDFRIYVFARQAQLLGKLGRITEIAKRGQWFIASLGRRLRESEPDLAEYFIESWTYSACMNIVQNCDEWSRIDRPNGDYSGLIAYESARSELLDIARVQIERVGVGCGHLPNQYPFASSILLSMSEAEDVLFESSENGSVIQEDHNAVMERASVSNGQILQAMEDQNRFLDLYLHLTKKAISAYEACGKGNSVIRLKADIAAVALLREDWQLTYELCRGLAKDCAELEIWTPIARFALEGALKAQDKLSLPKDEDWANLSLAYLRICCLSESDNGEKDQGSPLALEPSQILEDLRQSGMDLTTTNHVAFELRLTETLTRPSMEDDDVNLMASIECRLPFDTTVDSVSFELEDRYAEVVKFSKGPVDLKTGPNTIQVSCPTSTQGLFTLRQSSVRIGNVEYLYFKESADEAVKVLRNPLAPTVTLELPRHIALDREQEVILEIMTRRGGLRAAELVLQSVDGEMAFSMGAARSDSDGVSPSDQFVSIESVEPSSSLRVSVPYEAINQAHRINVRMAVAYTSTLDHQLKRLIERQSFSIALPLTVNVEDFFRPDGLVSHFTIASDGRFPLRIGSIELQADPNGAYEVQPASNGYSESTIIYPNQPLSRLFRLRLNSHTVSETPAVPRLSIQYRSLDEEILRVAQRALRIADGTAISQIQSTLRDSHDWVEYYHATQDAAGTLGIVLKATDVEIKDDELSRVSQTPLKPQELADDYWRVLEIPVDVPRRRLLTTARITSSSPGDVYEGRVLSMKVELSTTLFGLDMAEISDLKLFFDIQANGDDWVILGRKKGFFVADPSSPETCEMMLVPVRAGSLYLPNIQVQHASLTEPPNAESDPICETWVENAAEAINVLPIKSSATMLVG